MKVEQRGTINSLDHFTDLVGHGNDTKMFRPTKSIKLFLWFASQPHF